MKTKQIPIYRAACLLFEKVVYLADNFPRSRLRAFAPLIESSTDLLLNIRNANKSQKTRVEHCDKALDNVEIIELFSQAAFDTRTINNKAYAELIELTASVKRQAIGWKNSIK